MSTALTQQHAAVRAVLKHHGLTTVGDAVVEADLIAAMEQYHREASAARCPDCGESEPAEIHTCSPHKPASVEPVAFVNERAISWLAQRRVKESAHITTKLSAAKSIERPMALFTTPPDAEALRKRVAELEAERDSALEELGKVIVNLPPAEGKRSASPSKGVLELRRERDEARAEVEQYRKDAEGNQTMAELWRHAVRKGLVTIHSERAAERDPNTLCSWIQGHNVAADISNEAALAARKEG